MRREEIEYTNGLPIKMSLYRIDEYPIHWNDSLEIVFVLKGSLKIGIDAYENILEEGDIEIINVDELRWYKARDLDNMVLIINIAPEFFEVYYPQAKDLFFYTDIDSDTDEQYSLKYKTLRRYLSILLFEYVCNEDDYKEVLKKNLIKLMYHLVNNFHYLFYEGENLEEDEEELERYHRIIKYLNQNYMNKVSLQEIADREYLSSQYLSYKIKDTFGLGFNEYLNLIRVENSVKLLLSTDRSISDISEVVGFSHVRYFNRHFIKNFNLSPRDYRDKYQVGREEFESLKKFSQLSLDRGMAYVEKYIQDYDRYYYDRSVHRLDIDLSGQVKESFNFEAIIDLGDPSKFLQAHIQDLLMEAQRDIGFKYGILREIFPEKSMEDGQGISCNYYELGLVLDLLISLGLQPMIDTKDVDRSILSDFHKYFSNRYGEDISIWFYDNLEDMDFIYLEDNIKNDGLDMLGLIFENYIYGDGNLIFKLVDNPGQSSELGSDSFFGHRGIFTQNGLKKPSYYGFYYLSQLGDEVLFKHQSYIVTKSDRDFQVLLYDRLAGDKKYKTAFKKFSINIYNMQNDFQIRKYLLNEENGSIFDAWTDMGRPSHLSDEDLSLLSRFIYPKLSFRKLDRTIVLNLLGQVSHKGAIFYSLNSI